MNLPIEIVRLIEILEARGIEYTIDMDTYTIDIHADDDILYEIAEMLVAFEAIPTHRTLH